MKGKQPEKGQRAKKTSCGPNQGKWHEMNRKQRREVMRKMQSENLSLEVVQPVSGELIRWQWNDQIR